MQRHVVATLTVAVALSGASAPAAARPARHHGHHAKKRPAGHPKPRSRKRAVRRLPALPPAVSAFSLALVAPPLVAPAEPAAAPAPAAPGSPLAPAVVPTGVVAPVPAPPSEPTVPAAPAVPAPAVTTPAVPVSPPADRPFAADSVWNRPLGDDEPIDPGSAALVADLVRQVRTAGPWINTDRYTAPVYEPPPGTPAVPVRLDATDPALRQRLAAVPIPAGARPSKGTDGSMVVWSRSTDTVWELWRARLETDGWHATWGGRIDHASGSRGIFPAPYGVAASGLSLLGGMIRPADVLSGHIDHALAFCVPETTAGLFVPPATRTDGTVHGGGIPEGTRFRLPAGVDVAALGLPSMARKIAEAAQRYGIVVNDHGGAVSFYGEDPASIGVDPWPTFFGNRSPSQVLADFPWAQLEVVTPARG